jgi:hypothetical protein
MEFGTHSFIFAKLIGVPALFTVLLTISISPTLVWLYRRRLGAWMGQSSGSPASDGELPRLDAPHTVVLEELAQQAPDRRRLSSSALIAHAAAQIRRVARAYGIAGLAHAVVLTVAFALRHQSVISATSLAAAWVVFSLPAVMTVLHIVSSSGWRQLGWMAAVMLALIMVAGDARGLALDVFNLHLLVPGLIFLLFSLRFWRGVAPMTMLVLAAGSVGWVLFAQVGGWFSEGEGPLIWLLRLVGLAAGIWIGLKVLGHVAHRYEQRRFSDQALFLDAWWLLYTLIQTVIYLMTGGPVYVWVLLAFPVYWLVKRAMLPKPATPPPVSAHRLLLLRVFGFDRRTERFFDALSLRWRAVGAIELIAGRDLALRQIAPIDFVAFLTGKLADRFVRDPAAATATESTERPDPDGRFRVRQFLCHADTWRPVMRTLAARSDVVVMDLRGFTADREGCRYELQALARLAPDKPIFLVADRKTDIYAVAESLGVSANTHSQGAEHSSRWALVRALRGRDTGHHVFERIADQLIPQTHPAQAAD